MNGVANGVYGGDLPNQINTPWIDFSEQSTIVGWSSFTVKRIRYKVVGNIVYVSVNVSGTSNSTSTSFTLPISTKNESMLAAFGYAADSGATQIALFGQITVPSNVVNMYRYSTINTILATWTASGTKQIQGQFFYEI